MLADEPLLHPGRLARAARWWHFFLLAGLDLGLWHCLRYYRREHARLAHEGEDYLPPKAVWADNLLP